MIDKMLNWLVILWALLSVASIVAFGVWDYRWWSLSNEYEVGASLIRFVILSALHLLPFAIIAKA